MLKQVHDELKIYLKDKAEEVGKKAEMQNKKMDESMGTLQALIDQLKQEKEENYAKLQEQRERFVNEQQHNQEKEEQEVLNAKQKEKDRILAIMKDNAIRLIQIEYQEWKDAGGGKRKKRMGMGKKAKK